MTRIHSGLFSVLSMSLSTLSLSFYLPICSTTCTLVGDIRSQLLLHSPRECCKCPLLTFVRKEVDKFLRIIPLTITRLVFLNHASERVFDDFNIVLLTSIHANLNIVLTCIPFLKPVMDGIQSGILASDIRSLAPITSSGYLFSTNRKRSGKPEGFELENGHTADCSTAGAKQGNSEESMAIKRTREISIRYVSS